MAVERWIMITVARLCRQPEDEAALLYTKLTSHRTPHVYDGHFCIFDWSLLPSSIIIQLIMYNS